MRKIHCDLLLCVACKSCELACAVEHSKAKDLFQAIHQEQKPHKRVKVEYGLVKVIPVRCQHCDPAPCVLACMSGSMQKDPKTGRTIHDKDKCVGCWMCVMSCPFGALVRDTKEKIVYKCDLCPDRDTPACVEACPTGALFVGTAEEFEKHKKKEKIRK